MNSLSVESCLNVYESFPDCKNATTPYVVWLTNAYFGDDVGHLFQMDTYGTFVPVEGHPWGQLRPAGSVWAGPAEAWWTNTTSDPAALDGPEGAGTWFLSSNKFYTYMGIRFSQEYLVHSVPSADPHHLVGKIALERVYELEPCVPMSCLNNSFAHRMTDELALEAFTDDPPANASDPLPFLSARTQAIGRIVHMYRTPEFLSLYYASKQTGDFFSMVNCWNPSAKDLSGCTAVSNLHFVAQIRHERIFHDRHLHYYNLDQTGAIVGAMEYTTSGADDYDTFTRPWWRQRVGWSSVYIFDQIHMQSYSHETGTVIVGADRDTEESCTLSQECQATSFARHTVDGIAGAHLGALMPTAGSLFGLRTVTSLGELLAAFPRLKAQMAANQNGYESEIFLGFDNDVFVGVENCISSHAASVNPFCLYMRANYSAFYNFGAWLPMEAPSESRGDIYVRCLQWGARTLVVGSVRSYAEPCTQDERCLASSYARWVVDDLMLQQAQLRPQDSPERYRLDTPSRLFAPLATSLELFQTPYSVMLLVGQRSTGDYFAVRYCLGVVNHFDLACFVARTAYMGIARAGYLGDSRLHYFALATNGTVERELSQADFASAIESITNPEEGTAASLFKRSAIAGKDAASFFDSTYDLAGRAWFQARRGWTPPMDEYYMGSSQGQVQAYVNSTDDDALVMGAIRYDLEPCSTSEMRASSWAVTAMDDLQLALTRWPHPEPLARITGWPTVQALLKTIMGCMLANQNGYAINLYYTSNLTMDSYMVHSCLLPGFGETPQCISSRSRGYNYLGRMVFMLDDAGQAVSAGEGPGEGGIPDPLDGEVAPFDPTVRPWYNQTDGWGTVYPFESGSAGETLVRWVPQGLLCADRVLSEEDAALSCLRTSYAESVVNTLVAEGAPLNGSDYNTIFTTLMSVLTRNDNGYVVNFYVGQKDTCTFVGIKNCYHAMYSGSGTCLRASTHWVGEVVDPARFGNTLVHSFSLLPSGRAIGSYFAVGEEYHTCSRYWFTQRIGWSVPEEVSDLTGMTTAQTYIANHPHAIVAADRTPDEPCSTNCRTNSYAIPTVDAMAAAANQTDLLTRAVNASSLAEIGPIYRTLMAIAQDTQNGYMFCTYVATERTVYLLQSCLVDTFTSESGRLSPSSQFCTLLRQRHGLAANYLAFIRNEAAFGPDGRLRVFPVDDAGRILLTARPMPRFGWVSHVPLCQQAHLTCIPSSDVQGTTRFGSVISSVVGPYALPQDNDGVMGPLGVDSVPYNITGRYYWGITAPGRSWSTPRDFFLGGRGESLVYVWPPVDPAPGAPLLPARLCADRLMVESCVSQECLHNSEAMAVTGWLNSTVTPALFAQVTPLLPLMVSAIRHADTENRCPSVLVADRDNFVDILNCRHIVYRASATCAKAGGIHFVAQIASTRLFGDARLRTFRLSPTGTLVDGLGSPFETTDAFNATVRPWYIQKRGWTMTYEFAGFEGVGQGRAYVMTRDDGIVVGSDRTDDEPCRTQPPAKPLFSFPFPTIPAEPSSVTLSKSWVIDAVATVAGEAPSIVPPQGFDSEAAGLSYVSSLLTVMLAQQNGFVTNLFTGLEDGQLYLVQSCLGLYSTSPRCVKALGQSLNYIGIMVNLKVFGDLSPRVYMLADNGGAVAPTDGSGAGPSKRTSPWWTVTLGTTSGKQAGWTAAYDFADNARGMTYVSRATLTATSKAAPIGCRVGADRLLSESPIGLQCLRNSYASSAIDSISQQLARMGSATPGDEFFATMVSYLRPYATQEAVNLKVAFPNGDYYAIINCQHAVLGQTFAGCPAATGQWVGHKRVASTFRDGRLHYFNLDTTGKMTGPATPPESPDDFDLQAELWHRQRIGWTCIQEARPPTAQNATGGGEYQSYVADQGWVMLAADRSMAEPCQPSLLCHESSWANRAVAGLAGERLTPFWNATTEAEMLAPLQLIMKHVQLNQNGYMLNLFVGFDNNMFWMIQFCLSFAFYDVESCEKVTKLGYNYLASVVNMPLWGSSARVQCPSADDDSGSTDLALQRHILAHYALFDNGSVVTNTPVAVLPRFVVDERDWYLQPADGWSSVREFFAGGRGERNTKQIS
ncbi:hypothetical protein PAPYR_1760 [Paratrimastix pyriformis]|uniref:Uncharacterized protein n=1 Tax=Paratrimastix pyriformis TaxID=342808 RepID=A0ABQ8USZ1_9EUKA|nr:hypothetical protein PAPYR_1760 [Paratrimastix pyriformis]